MTRRNTGGILSATEQATDANTANGIFTLSEVTAATAAGSFPTGRFTPQASVRFRSQASAYLSRTPGTAGNRTTWTWSGWVKRGALDARQFITMSGTNPNPSQVWQVEFDANNKLDFYNQTINTYRRTTQVFRDSSAWYHIVFGADTNNATAQNRFRCWVNGVEITAWDVNSTISSGYTFAYNGAYLHGIGAYTYSGNVSPLDGYLTEVNFIDGQALTPSSFGTTDPETGVWVPKRYSGTYGTNGYYLVPTIGNLAYDQSGNGANWSANNMNLSGNAADFGIVDVPGIAAVTSQPDVGGVQRGNYATLNPLIPVYSGATVFSNANLGFTVNSNGGVTDLAISTIPMSSGKWYAECTVTATPSAGTAWIGVCSNVPAAARGLYGASVRANGYGYKQSTGYKCNGDNTGVAYGATYTTGDIIGIALDLDNRTITFYKNGISQGVAFTSITSTDGNFVFGVDSDPTATFNWNFGQRPFSYTPPAGFKSVCTTNIPNPIIKRPSDHFDVKTYTGNGGQLMVGTTAKQLASASIGKSLRFKSSTKTYLNRFIPGGAKFNGSSQYFTAASSSVFAFGTGSWTIEAWVYVTTLQEILLFDTRTSAATTGVGFRIEPTTGKLTYSGSANNSLTGTGSTNAISANAWAHVALVYDGTTLTGYINGQISGSATPAFNLSTTSATIGRVGFSSSGYMAGYVSNLRVVKGVAVYTGNFTVPTTALTATQSSGTNISAVTGVQTSLLLFAQNSLANNVQNNYAQDTSTNGLTITNNGTVLISSSPKLPALGSALPSTTTWTWSGWVKRSVVGTSQRILSYADAAGWDSALLFDSSNKLRFYETQNSSFIWDLKTNAAYADVSQWYHITCVLDTTNAVASQRAKLYVNGVQITSLATATFPAQNTTGNYNNSTFNNLVIGGYYPDRSSDALDAYLAEVNFIDGQALTPASFGQFDANNNWAPKTYTGTYGSGGFRLDFSDADAGMTNPSWAVPNAGMGKDVSGNGNYFQAVGFGHWGATVESFTTVGTTSWTAPAGVTSVNYLVVAGGGSGGGQGPSGGGGAGGVVTGTLAVTPGSSYTVTVGAGGISTGGSVDGNGRPGNNSVFSTVTAIGGGGGIAYNIDSGTWASSGVGNGGSGGGGGTGGLGTPGQGNNGGAGKNGSGGLNSGDGFNSGAGGGAGMAAVAVAPNSGAPGGAGRLVSITGSDVYYGGGGGGGMDSARVGGGAAGGIGGGGSSNQGSNGSAGTANTGGGGGGGSNRSGSGGTGYSGGDGGSGIVVLAYSATGLRRYNSYDPVYDTPIDTVDSSGNVIGNYAVGDANVAGGGSWTNGGLTANIVNGANYSRLYSSLTMTTGKWYWEVTLSANAAALFGIASEQKAATNAGTTGYYSTEFTYYGTGQSYNNGILNSYGASFAAGDIIGIAFDADSGNLTFYKNNATQGVAFIVPNGIPYWAVFGSASGTVTAVANFGQMGFRYTPPAGFKALNTKNLKDVGSYNLPDTFGNFVNTPDLVWTKSRSGADNHYIHDSVRGAGNRLCSNLAIGESAENKVISFLPNGFMHGSDAGGNAAGGSYVAWMWNRGKIPGFDIVTYTGTGANNTIRHNLGQTPAFMTVKNFTNSTSSNWMVYHKNVGAQYAANFNGTSPWGTSVEYWNGNETGPGPTTFSVGINANTNALNISYVAYLWAEVPGFSKMGEWTGNGSADGPFVYCGFRPRFVLLHRATDTTSNWDMIDSARDPVNPMIDRLFAESNSGDLNNLSATLDFTSNGFKIRTTDTSYNSGVRYLFVAFAETPFKYANAR